MKILLASHGNFAEGLYSAVRLIAGDDNNIEAFGLDKWETPGAIAAEVQKRIDAKGAEHLAILCDIKGGSVCNALLPLCAQPGVSLICGMNLNLALELAFAPANASPRAVQHEAIQLAKEQIQYFDADELDKLQTQDEEDELW